MSQTTVPAHHKPPVPAMVRRAAEAAEAAHAAFMTDPNAPPSAEGNPPADAPAGDSPSDVPASPAPAPSAAPPAPPTPEPTENVDWKHRFDSLKGKHDQITARVQAQADEISNLHKVISAMQAAPAASTSEPSPEFMADFKFAPITQQERDDFGEDMISVAERAAAQKFAPVIEKLVAEVAQLRAGVSGVAKSVQQDAQQTAMELLSREVPEWATLNNDPGFLGWLQEVDPFSGVARQSMLDSAVQSNNGPRIVAFFKGYKQTLAPAPSGPNPSVDPPRTEPRRTSLETFAAPGRGRSGTPAGPPSTTGSQPVFRQSEISRFYEDVRKGLYRNNPAEKARIERDIFEATAAGRLVAG